MGLAAFLYGIRETHERAPRTAWARGNGDRDATGGKNVTEYPATTGGTAEGRVIGPIGDRHQPLREVVLAELRTAIITGRFQPGERLVEDRLATDLGVSRNPVREALRTLESEGLVTMTRRRGATIAVVSDEEARQLFEVREPLETFATRLAARRRTEEQLEELRAILQAGDQYMADGRYGELPVLNSRFHRVIAEASGNEVLMKQILPLREKIQMIYAPEVEKEAHTSWEEHRAILEAVDQGDEDLAALLTSRHIQRAKMVYGLATDES